MKVITVDDQFVNAKGKPMESVPLVMMAASEIGARQGQELYKEMQKRGWDVKDTAVMAITADELDTARRRTTGSIDALKAAGFPDAQIYRVPTKSNDIPGAFDAGNSMLVQHPQVKHWLIVGMNDNTVLGGVRATEGQGFKAPDDWHRHQRRGCRQRTVEGAADRLLWLSAAKPGYPRLQNQRNALQLGHQGRRAAEVHGGDRCGADYPR